MVLSSATHMWSKNFLNFVYGRFRPTILKEMASLDAVQRLETRASQAENLISVLKAEVSELQKAADFCKHNIETYNVKKYEEMKFENEKLKNEINEWKARLIEAEKKLGIQPVDVCLSKTTDTTTPVKESKTPPPAEQKKKAEKPKQEEKKADKKPAAGAGDDLPVDVRRLDIRVGKIVSVKKHPDADSLYVEEVDLGEGKPRTVVSGLVKFVPIEEMENRMVVALCNLKPAKMRGVTSEAMVLCASTPEKVEVLIPPPGSAPGDRITVEGYSGEPDGVLNPKKKIFETVAPDLKTDAEKVATYKGAPFSVAGKGVVTTQSLSNVQIK